jgi:hypothetical protein
MRRWLERNRQLVETTIAETVRRIQSLPVDSSPLDGHELKALFKTVDGRWIHLVKEALGEWARQHPDEAKNRAKVEEVARSIFLSVGADTSPQLNPGLHGLVIEDPALLGSPNFPGIMRLLVGLERLPFGEWKAWAGDDKARAGLVGLLSRLVTQEGKTVSATAVVRFFEDLRLRVGDVELSEVAAAWHANPPPSLASVATWISGQREALAQAQERYRKHASPRAAQDYVEALLNLNKETAARRELRSAAQRWPSNERIKRLVSALAETATPTPTF